MWIILNDAFLSIVADPDKPKQLKVRGRFEGDIERIFPEAEVLVDAGTDYRYRAWLPRERVAEVLSQRAMALNSTNFKASVPPGWRYDLYMKVWSLFSQEQKRSATTSHG